MSDFNKAAETQAIITWLTDRLQELEELSIFVDWYNVPWVDYVMTNPPVAYVYPTTKQLNQHGYQHHYQYTLGIICSFIVEQNVYHDEDRRIYKIEEAVEDFIIQNRQPDIAELVPVALTITNIDYESSIEVVQESVIESVNFDMEFIYNRVVAPS